MEKFGERRARAKIHRALADEHRARIVDELDAEPAGIDVHELARRLGLHANTVRWHLGILGDAGLVSSRTRPRTTPGRPRILYTLADEPESQERENYRLLATILSGSLSGLADGRTRAVEGGDAWGRYLVRRPPPGTRSSETDLRAVVELLEDEGFRPVVGDSEIRMRHCPFRELAESGGEVVCAVHEGLIAGALAELGSTLELERLDPFVEPQLCIARLGPRADEPAAGPDRPA
ncbi:MAG TPA: helix-turn-helix domain-containing protein [Gaiellaceae bacterium]|nr:helix-turn-helix domain-containing protein [Gaiellaceae bacterium]